VTYPGRGGAMIRVPHRDVLARGRVRYVGQEVALVVAASLAEAQDAAEAIEVEYRELPAVVDAEAALSCIRTSPATSLSTMSTAMKARPPRRSRAPRT
jgi:CO/xanthine dehydrogenase Mo-binding subunit